MIERDPDKEVTDPELAALMADLGTALAERREASAKLKRPRRTQDEINEALYQAEIWRLLGSRPDVRLWRQNAGSITFADSSGRLAAFKGAPKGAADLTGIVRPEGWRLEIEVKGPAYVRGKDKERDEAQDNWAEFIQSAGGIYIFARWHKVHSLAENVDRVNYQLDVELAKKRGQLPGQSKSTSKETAE